jgi:hypothetical protein
LNLYASRSILSGKQPVLAIWVPLQLTRTKWFPPVSYIILTSLALRGKKRD